MDNQQLTINGDEFDLANYAMTRIDTGAEFILINPASGAILRHPDKTPVTITFVSQHSEAFRDIMREIQLNRARWRSNQPVVPVQADPLPIPYEMEQEENAMILVACCLGWNITTLGGQPFPFNAQNARKLFTDEKYVWIRLQALNFIQRDGNFLSSASRSSSASLDTASAS